MQLFTAFILLISQAFAYEYFCYTCRVNNYHPCVTATSQLVACGTSHCHPCKRGRGGHAACTIGKCPTGSTLPANSYPIFVQKRAPAGPSICDKTTTPYPNCKDVINYARGCPLDDMSCKFPTYLATPVSNNDAAIANALKSLANAAAPLAEDTTLAPLVSAARVVTELFSMFAGGMSADEAYAKMMTNLIELRQDILNCVNEKIINMQVKEIEADLTDIRSNLNPNLLLQGSPKTRLATIFVPNYAFCRHMKDMMMASTNSTFEFKTLRYAVEIMNICTANFLGQLADMKADTSYNYTESDGKLVMTEYKMLVSGLETIVKQGIDVVDSWQKSGGKCSKYASFRTLVQQKVTFFQSKIYDKLLDVGTIFR